MFFVGVASMAGIGWNLLRQYSSEKSIRLEELEPDQRDRNVPLMASGSRRSVADEAAEFGEQLFDLPKSLHGFYLWERLVNALHSIYRSNSTGQLENELKYLSETDQIRQQQRYSLVRILIWATPMLGFLGTVLGISQALGGIDVGPDNDFQNMMNGLRGNLYVAFDTTALALTLSMVLMFLLFLVEKFESQLLRLVDQRANSELTLFFDITPETQDQSQTREVVSAIHQVVESQTEIWRNSIRSAEKAWASTLTEANSLVRDNLTESLDENVAALAHYLGESIDKADDAMARRWAQWQVILSDNARQLEKHQHSLTNQTESVQSIVSALDQSTAFESAMKQQQEAIEATTRTHDVLAQVLRAAHDLPLMKKDQSESESEISRITENEISENEVPKNRISESLPQQIDKTWSTVIRFDEAGNSAAMKSLAEVASRKVAVVNATSEVVDETRVVDETSVVEETPVVDASPVPSVPIGPLKIFLGDAGDGEVTVRVPGQAPSSKPKLRLFDGKDPESAADDAAAGSSIEKAKSMWPELNADRTRVVFRDRKQNRAA